MLYSTVKMSGANVQNHDMSAQEPFYGLMAFFTASPTTNILYGRFFMNTNDLANRLKFLRAKANYTQSYVCSKIHLSRSSYSNYENGLRVPPLDILKLLAEFYDTSLDYLVGMTDCPEKYPFASAEMYLLFAT